jgi:DNA-binding beta-propeller fold protein YncE
MRAAPRLAMTADHNTLYVSQVIFSPQKIYRFDITTDIPDQTADAPHGPVNVNTLAVNPDGSKVYSSRGQVWNGDLNTLLGIYYSSQEIEYLAGYNRFYLSDTTNNQLIAHDGDVYLPIRYHPLAGTPGVARANAAETMMYVSTNAGVEVIDLTIPENPPTAVSVAGPMTGLLSTSYSFTATVDPPTTTVPVIYSWQATGQTDVSQSNLLSDTVSFAWLTTGPKMITVTATNATGEVVTGTHTITMTGPPIPDPVTYFDMVLAEPRQLIYGTDQDGDLIHVVDMNTLDVISSVPVGIGSGPTGLDISPSGDELAVALPEADEIAFVDLNTLLVTDVITPSSPIPFNNPYDVIYGRPGRLYSGNQFCCGRIHVFDTNTKTEIGQSTTTAGAYSRLGLTADNNTLYIAETNQSPEFILRFDVTTDSPVQTAQTSLGVAVNTMAVHPDGSKVFTSQGQVWNGALDMQLGSFSPDGQEIEYIPGLNRFYISNVTQIVEFDGNLYLPLRYHPLGDDAGVARANAAATTLYVSTDSGIETVALDVPGVPPTAVSIAGAAEGATGVPQVFTATVSPASATIPFIYTWQATAHPQIIQSDNLSDTISYSWPTDGPKTITVTAENITGQVVTATHTITMTGPPVPNPALYVDMVVDENRQLIYGSAPNGDFLHVVDLNTLNVITSVPLGEDAHPVGIDISPDGNEIAVALNGRSELAFIDLDTLQVTDRVVPQGTSGPNRPYDVLYGRPGRLYSSGNPGSSGSDYIHTIDTVNKVEVGRSSEIMRSGPRMAMTADHNTLYVGQATFSPQKIYRFDITTDIPDQTAVGPHGPMRVNTMAVTPDGSKVFSSRGQIWDGDLSTQLGSFNNWGEYIAYSPAFDRFFISTGSQIDEYYGGDYSFVRTYQVGGNAGAAQLNSAETILYVSTANGVVEIELGPPVVPVMTVDIDGPTGGNPNIEYTFTATVVPITATQPITYIWEIEGQGTFTYTNQGPQHSVTFDWSSPGAKSITVTAINSAGSAVANHTINLTNPTIYLPAVLKQ